MCASGAVVTKSRPSSLVKARKCSCFHCVSVFFFFLSTRNNSEDLIHPYLNLGYTLTYSAVYTCEDFLRVKRLIEVNSILYFSLVPAQYLTLLY